MNRITKFTLIAVTVLAAMTSCSKDSGKFQFNSAKEAVKACHKELLIVSNQSDATIEKVGHMARHWLTLQDSCYSIFLRDTTFDYNGDLAADFVTTSDSIRDKIIDIALSRPRSLQGTVKLKVLTSHNRDAIIASKDFKDVKEFYSSLDKIPSIKDKASMLKGYNLLLDSAKLTLDEKKLRKFLAEEDIYFRSLMNVLTEVSDDELQTITDKTARVFNVIDEKSLEEEKKSGKMSRSLLYLTMRFNRRIIQNAEICSKDIMAKKKLSEQTAANYRWMLIQPLMSIDNDAMATLTEEQIKTLMDIAEQLPKLMAYVDGKDYDSLRPEETMKLAQILSSYFLKSHLKSIL